MKRSLCVPVAALLVAGCADARLFRRSAPVAVPAAVAPVSPPVVPASASTPAPPDPPVYRIGCPDVVEVAFADRPHWDGLASVDVDGELPLGPAGRVRVEGLSEAAARDAVAAAAGVEPAAVSVRVVDPRAARVFVCGPENGKQRPVAYRGPERALDFLWRVGAVKKGCSDLDDVYVVRSNVSAGGRPQVLRVDVAAVVFDGNPESNVVLQPSDQVYIGETRRSRFGRLVPEWLQPLYRRLVGLFPADVWPRR